VHHLLQWEDLLVNCQQNINLYQKSDENFVESAWMSYNFRHPALRCKLYFNIITFVSQHSNPKEQFLKWRSRKIRKAMKSNTHRLKSLINLRRAGVDIMETIRLWEEMWGDDSTVKINNGFLLQELFEFTREVGSLVELLFSFIKNRKSKIKKYSTEQKLRHLERKTRTLDSIFLRFIYSLVYEVAIQRRHVIQVWNFFLHFFIAISRIQTIVGCRNTLFSGLFQ
jgi:hypothetical protein